jgi:hypothetical protein
MSLKREVYVEEATKLQLETLKKIAKAPVKRGWNSTFRVSIPSINDIKREFNQRLGAINELCESDGHAPLYADPDKEEVTMDSFE